MRLVSLLREALASAWASKVPTLLVTLVTATMCFVALGTVGQVAANNQAVAERMEAAGARRLSVIDSSEQGFITAPAVAMVSQLSSVSSALRVGAAQDVYNGAIGRGADPVTMWEIDGDLQTSLSLVRGRWAAAGEALVSTKARQAMGLAEPVGFVIGRDGQSWPVVGEFASVAPFDDFSGGVVVNGLSQPGARELRVVITDINQAEASQTAVLRILAPVDPSRVEVESPAGIADTARTVGNQLAGFGQALLLLILGVGAFFVASVVLADSLVRRRDLGRRRTLGATRSDLLALVVLRTLAPSFVGAVLGCGIAALVNALAGHAIPLDFTAAVGVLALLTGLVAALPPAWFAATRDPVRVMRTP